MPLSNACAAATAAAAAQLGSHLLFLDPGATQHRSSQSRHTSDFGKPTIEEVSEAAVDITNHLCTPAPIQRDLPSIILPAVCFANTLILLLYADKLNEYLNFTVLKVFRYTIFTVYVSLGNFGPRDETSNRSES